MHPDSTVTHDDPEVKNPQMRLLAVEELKQITKLVTYLDKLDVLDVAVEVHDVDGVKLGEVRKHDDWGYCFFAAPGGEVGG